MPSHWRALRSLALLVLGLVGLGPPALAERLEPAAPGEFSHVWSYRRFGGWDAAITAGGGAITLTSLLLGPPEEPRWRGGILFDDALRDGLRARSRAGRDRAKAVGDAVYRAGALLPTLVDGLIVTLAVRQAPSVAAQMLLINLEAYAVAAALSTATENGVARERPSEAPCRSDPEYEAFCGASGKVQSFISGHTAAVATSAGLLCAHHQYLHLYGARWADLAACGVGVGAALTSGVARMMNDRHYASDILMGLVVGGLSGYALPVLGYYERGQDERAREWRLAPLLSQGAAGLSWFGVF